MFRLPRLNIATAVVDTAGKPTGTFIQWWQTVVTQIERAISTIVDLTGIQEQFEQQLAAAKQATKEAQDAAAAAQGAADQAQAQADATKKEQALVNSYIDPSSVLTANPNTITVAAHRRYYADGTNVAVSAGSVDATGSGDVDYVFYSDPNRTGGNVTYQVDTTNPAQTGSTHVVGAVTIPATGEQPGGRGPQKPGYVTPDQN